MNLIGGTKKLTVDNLNTEIYKNNRNIIISGNLIETITGSNTLTIMKYKWNL